MTAFARRTALALPAAAALAAPAIPRAQGATEITIHYCQPFIFQASYDAITAAFARLEPSIRITYVTSPNYPDGAQFLLRQSAINQPPDLSFQGMNFVRLFADRRIAQDLTPFIARGGTADAQGYSDRLLSLGRFAGFQAGLPYAASTAITFFNGDLVRRAGFNPDALPADWDGHIRMAAALRERTGGIDGMFFSWHEWMFQTMLLQHRGQVMTTDESDIAFDGPEGLATLRYHERFVTETAMPALTSATASQAFSAGRLGAFYWTTAVVRNFIQSVGTNFELRTATLPIVPGIPDGSLATGGAIGLLTSRDAAKREAAWKFLRFSTSPEGTTLMVKNSGYVPMNQIAIDDPRFLSEFYRDNPLFRAATEQAHKMAPWFAFPGPNAVRITQAITNNVARVIERQATPEVALRDMAAEVRRLLPRRS